MAAIKISLLRSATEMEELWWDQLPPAPRQSVLVMNEATTQPVDVQIENCGSIFTFQPLTDAASDWIEQNVPTEPWQWMGGRMCVEHRFARNLAQGMLDDGLKVK